MLARPKTEVKGDRLILLDNKAIDRVKKSVFYWDKERERPMFIGDRPYVEPRAMVKATGQKILIELQAIYNLPDGGMFHNKMGEFIKELKGEICT